MGYYHNAWKQFKKRIQKRRRRVALTLGTILFCLLIAPQFVEISKENVPVMISHDSSMTSPNFQTDVYFSVDHEGNLCLFDGDPDKKKVMRTFFQLDIDYLESSLPQRMVDHLYAGIKVSDHAEYDSVLSTFSDYAIQESEKVSNTLK